MPRTYVTADRTRLAGDYNVTTRVEVKDSDGTWRDLTAYTGGRNFFVSAKWSRGIDQPIMTGTVTFLRAVLGASLAPTIVASIMNTNAASAYSPLLSGGRGLRLSTACTAVGVAPVAGDWKEMFLGRIDDPDWGGADDLITCTISDVGAWLLGKQIDTERQYGSSGGTPLETAIQSILTDNVSGPLGAVTLYVPVSPGWNIRTYTQAKGSVLLAIRALAQQIGWDVRFVYDAANVYRLTLFQPQRTKTVADYTITGAEYYGIPQLIQNLTDVRTRIGGSYVDHATGARLWRYVQADAAHTNQYDVVYMEISEDASSNIDSSVEMDKMINAALSDLQDPAATQRVESSYFWLAELGDLVGWAANAVHYDATQNLAVVGIEHSLDVSGETTALICRGKVAGSYKQWLTTQGGGVVGSPVPTLDNFRRSAEVPGQSITYSWDLGALTASVWAKASVVATNTADPWPAVAAAVVSIGTATSITIPWPGPGQMTLLQVEPRDALLIAGVIRQAVEKSVSDGIPKIIQSSVAGTVVTVLGNSNVQSIRIRDMSAGGTWESWVDCAGAPSSSVDLSLASPTGVAGIGAGVTWPVEIDAYAKPKAYAAGLTPDIQTVTVTNGTSTAPTWVVCSAASPTNGSAVATLTLQASSAPTGYTARVSERHDIGVGFSAYANITASLAPALTAPPTVSTAYTYTTLYTADSTSTKQVTYQFKAEILNGAGTVVRTQTVFFTYYYT